MQGCHVSYSDLLDFLVLMYLLLQYVLVEIASGAFDKFFLNAPFCSSPTFAYLICHQPTLFTVFFQESRTASPNFFSTTKILPTFHLR
jgi:hypothetical protein